VTTVTGVLDKPALVEWKRRQVAAAALDHAERLVDDKAKGNVEAAIAFLLKTRNEGTNSRERGSRLHETLEGVLRREGPAIDPRDEPAIAGARSWLNENQVMPLEVEAFMINETLGYGGTCDLVATIAGETWLLDWKTSKSVAFANGKVFDEYRLQLAAYANAELIARVGDAERYAVPAITRYGILHVTDGGTRLYEAAVTEQDWITFRACLYVYNWRQGWKGAA
jgi:hypothetical protein